MRGTILSLYPWDKLAEDAQVPSSGSGFRGFTVAHNVASREEVDQIVDQAVKAGAKLAKPAQKTAWEAITDTFLILMITCGKWPGILTCERPCLPWQDREIRARLRHT